MKRRHYKDKLVRAVKWEAAAGHWRANFNQKRLYQLGNRGRIYFSLTLAGFLFEFISLIFILFFYLLGLLGLVITYQNSVLAGVLLSVFYLVIMTFWLYFNFKNIVRAFQPVIFDVRRGIFIKGWKQWFYDLVFGRFKKAQRIEIVRRAAQKGLQPIAILDIIGLQLLSKGFRHHRDKAKNYDINIILHNKSRHHVASYFNKESAQRDIERLSQNLDVRIIQT